MKKLQKIALFCYCLLFFCICALPGAMLFAGNTQEENTENRELAAVPSLIKEDGSFNEAWSSQVQSYVSDHFGFRSALVTADSTLKAKLLHTSAEEDVIIGKNGWLYYTPTVQDYLGNPTVSDLGIANICRNLEMMQDYAAQMNSRLLVTVVPNKSTVYPQYMPANYKPSGVDNNLTRLTQAIADAGLPYCDMAQALTASAADVQLYHKHDSHWNNTGALCGYRALLDAAGITHTTYDDLAFEESNVWEGDLQRMLFPQSTELDVQHVYPISFTYRYLGRYKDADDLNIDTMQPTGNGALLMFRDSFGEAIIPYLSEHFATAKYSRARPYPMHHLENMQYDLVIAEIVERNISWLQKEAPKHHALTAAEVPAADRECDGTLYVVNDGTKYLHLYGTMEFSDAEQAPRYYVTLTDAAGTSTTYLAYNCYEAELLGDDEVRDNGFSLWLDSAFCNTTEPCSITVTADMGTHVQQKQFSGISLAANVH